MNELKSNHIDTWKREIEFNNREKIETSESLFASLVCHDCR